MMHHFCICLPYHPKGMISLFLLRYKQNYLEQDKNIEESQGLPDKLRSFRKVRLAFKLVVATPHQHSARVAAPTPYRIYTAYGYQNTQSWIRYFKHWSRSHVSTEYWRLVILEVNVVSSWNVYFVER